MPTNAQLEDKLLNASEADIVAETRAPKIARQSRLEELRNLADLLRAHDKAKELPRASSREILGKAKAEVLRKPARRRRAQSRQNWSGSLNAREDMSGVVL